MQSRNFQETAHLYKQLLIKYHKMYFLLTHNNNKLRTKNAMICGIKWGETEMLRSDIFVNISG